MCVLYFRFMLLNTARSHLRQSHQEPHAYRNARAQPHPNAIQTHSHTDAYAYACTHARTLAPSSHPVPNNPRTHAHIIAARIDGAYLSSSTLGHRRIGGTMFTQFTASTGGRAGRRAGGRTTTELAPVSAVKKISRKARASARA